MDQDHHPSGQPGPAQGHAGLGKPEAARYLLADMLESSRLYHTSKEGARPLLILWPLGPVPVVYDDLLVPWPDATRFVQEVALGGASPEQSVLL